MSSCLLLAINIILPNRSWSALSIVSFITGSSADFLSQISEWFQVLSGKSVIERCSFAKSWLDKCLICLFSFSCASRSRRTSSGAAIPDDMLRDLHFRLEMGQFQLLSSNSTHRLNISFISPNTWWPQINVAQSMLVYVNYAPQLFQTSDNDILLSDST